MDKLVEVGSSLALAMTVWFVNATLSSLEVDRASGPACWFAAPVLFLLLLRDSFLGILKSFRTMVVAKPGAIVVLAIMYVARARVVCFADPYSGKLRFRSVACYPRVAVGVLVFLRKLGGRLPCFLPTVDIAARFARLALSSVKW